MRTKTKMVLVGHDTRQHKNSTRHKIKYSTGGQGLDLPGTLNKHRRFKGPGELVLMALVAKHLLWPSLDPVHVR